MLVLNEEFFDIQATVEFEFNLKAYVTSQEDTVKCTVHISTHNTAESLGLFHLNVECSSTNYVVLSSSPVAVA